jgi:hypothetical protein
MFCSRVHVVTERCSVANDAGKWGSVYMDTPRLFHVQTARNNYIYRIIKPRAIHFESNLKDGAYLESYLLICTMWPSSTPLSFMDWSANLVQTLRAKIFTSSIAFQVSSSPSTKVINHYVFYTITYGLSVYTSELTIIQFIYKIPNIRRCIQKFLDWLPGARTANDTALCR